MSSFFLKIFYALLLLLLYASGFNWATKKAEAKCIERERQALLNFKQGLLDQYGMLSTWREDENNGDCCKWKGIECNNETGHVQMLHLRAQDPQYLIGAINITSLIDLQNMEYLDLSYNAFRVSPIPELIGSFTKLRYLNLSYSEFGGRIPSKLGELTNLRYLDMRSNDLYGEIPYQLGNLFQLQHLDVGGNSLSGAIPFKIGNLPYLHTLRLGGSFDVKTDDADWLSTLYSLKNLELGSFSNLGSSFFWLQIGKLIPNLRELRLIGCGLLDNDISSLFQSHSNFSTSLNILDLSDNMLTSSSFQLLSDFSLNLEELYLRGNNIVWSSPLYPNFPSLTILDLSNNMLTSSSFQLLSNFSLNLQELYLSGNSIVWSSPLYPNFHSLVILDLSYNNLTSSIFKGNFNFSSKLQKLSLQNCSLVDRSFPVSFASIMNSSSSLVYLDLSSNLLKSSAIFHWLFNFTTNLQNLDLYGNLLDGLIPDGFGKVMNSLKVLDLSYNKLQGEIPTFFGNICTLETLSLSNNNLSGKMSSFIQNSSWCNRHIFQSLDLSDNQITGMLPETIGLLSELEDLQLDGNSLQGDIIESHLSNFSKLKFLSLSDNSLSVKFPSSWVPPFQLKYLGLSSCNLGPHFPSWLQTQSSLMYLDISDNEIKDSVPKWLWNNSQYMEEMNMSHNNLIGAIPNLPFNLHNKPYIILNSNQFEGGVPSFLRQASRLMLFENKFSNLFSFLCDKNPVQSLATLDLSNNQLKGQLPDCWKSVNSLLFLDLRNNKLSGKIPQSMGTLVKLEALVLRNNSLMGELPSTLKNCCNLILLDVGENLLSGLIPSWIGESMQQLMILSMKENSFSGNIPLQLCYLRHIQLLDLSRNHLSKGIPTCIKNFTAMSERSINSSETRGHIYWYNDTYFEIYGVFSFGDYTFNITLMWKGMERGFKDPEFRLKSIDLSCNNLTGEMPKELGYLLGLVSLNLSMNNLSGKIPFEIGNLYSLEFLDLSRNSFSGKIPSSLSQIDRLTELDLSYNSLSGRIPFGRQLQTFEASSFEGNIGLCGQQLDKRCPDDEGTIKPQGPAVHGEDENSVFYEALYMSLGIGFFTGFWGLIGPILLWQPWRNVYLRFLNRFIDCVYVMVVVNVAKCHRWLNG